MSSHAVRVTVPGSTANLGSGFDALGMALALHDIVDVRAEAGGTDLGIDVHGQGADVVARDERHLLVRAVRATLDELDVGPFSLRLRCVNRIPHSRGLGSSAAAVIAGIAAGYAIAGAPMDDMRSDARALRIAADFEGHADNVAASLYGGLVLTWAGPAGFRASRMEPHPHLRPVALVPEVESATTATRGLLPEFVSHSDAAFSAGRAALVVHAMTSAPELLLDATEDRLHQDYRTPAWPRTAELVKSLRARGIPAAVSGAGPTVLAFAESSALSAMAVEIEQGGFVTRPLAVDREGVRVESMGRDEVS